MITTIFIAGAVFGTITGIHIGLFVHRWRKFGSIGRAWCATWHRNDWSATSATASTCPHCERKWHRC